MYIDTLYLITVIGTILTSLSCVTDKNGRAYPPTHTNRLNTYHRQDKLFLLSGLKALTKFLVYRFLLQHFQILLPQNLSTVYMQW